MIVEDMIRRRFAQVPSPKLTDTQKLMYAVMFVVGLLVILVFLIPLRIQQQTDNFAYALKAKTCYRKPGTEDSNTAVSTVYSPL
jgi:hypothetical protein